MKDAALVQINAVDFDDTAVRIYINESLFSANTSDSSCSSSSASSSTSRSGRPLKWTHKAPLLATMAKLDVGCCAERDNAVRELRYRVRKLDKSMPTADFLAQRELSDEFPLAVASLSGVDGDLTSGDYFQRTATFAQLLVTTRLVKQQALVAPDHSQFAACIGLLQTLLSQCDSPLLSKFARRIADRIRALTELQAASPLNAAELGAPTSRLSLDWRTMRASDLQLQGSMAGRLVLSDEQRQWAVSLCDRVEKAVDTVNAISTFRRFAPVIRFLQGTKQLAGVQPLNESS